MARPAQFERFDPPLIRESVKRLGAADRAYLLAWLCTYFRDDGEMWSPQIRRGRQRIVLDGTEYWLVKVPKTK